MTEPVAITLDQMKTVIEHQMADLRMKRDWDSPQGCGCAACRMARDAGWKR